LLVTSIFASGIAFYYDYNYPFSNGKNVASYIRENFDLNNSVIIGIPSSKTETITGYLNKDFYYPQEHGFNRLVRWNNIEEVTIDSFRKDLSELENEYPKDNILIIKSKYGTLSSIISDDFLYFYKYEKINDFSNSIVSKESYIVYLLNNNLNFSLIKKMDLGNFSKDWKNINNFEFEITKDNYVLIDKVERDPNFESNFQIPTVNKGNKLYIKIDIEVAYYCGFAIYYKREGASYSERNKVYRDLIKGENYLFIQIEDPYDIQAIRIDPVNEKTECIIKSIEFYESYNK
jgi:hypothetical protein